jgi:integrase
MPRAKNDYPSYRRHRASGQAVVTLNGVDHYLGRFGSPESKAEYDRIIAEWLIRGRRLADRRDVGVKSDQMLIKELILGYFGYLSPTLPKVEADKLRRALRPVRDLFGETVVSEFGPVRFKAVRTKMVDSGLCISTINYRLGVIRRMIAWGVENEMLPGDALHRLEAVAPLKSGRDAKAPRKVLPVSEEDIRAILPHLQPTVRTMVELQALTGMRPGELCRMTMGQIDRTGDPWIYRPAKHKTATRGKDRPIPLGPRAQELLKQRFKADPDAALFSPSESVETLRERRRQSRKTRPCPYELRRSRNRKRHPKRAAGTSYSTVTYGDAVHRACVRAGVPAFRPNRIRHSFGTRVRHEYGLEAAQVLLGHSKADVTQIYAERNMALARDVAAKIG